MTGPKANVLLVDDDAAVRRVLAALLEQDGYGTVQAESADRALALLDEQFFDLCITDLRMPGMDGMALLKKLSEERADLPVIVLTAHGSVPLAVEAMRFGAVDFLLKPFDRAEILFVVGKAVDVARAKGRSAPASGAPAGVVGGSPKMKELMDLVARAAPKRSTVLVRGESGTGKELVARAIHDGSPRKDKPFIKVHCAALPDTLLESELFGYEKGAFTGAVSRKPGRVELAEGGTLFLDEIGDITPAMQVKLLRVLQEREYERLGGKETLRADVRFVAATHRDLERMVADGEFREDLFYRLAVVPIWLPPLRDRREDIPGLARHFCGLAAADAGVQATLDEEAIELLCDQPWPGNVRQLQNFIERLVVLSDGPALGAEDVLRELARSAPASTREGAGGTTGDETLSERRNAAERDALVDALQRARNNRTEAARLLGVSRRTLYKKLAAFGMS